MKIFDSILNMGRPSAPAAPVSPATSLGKSMEALELTPEAKAELKMGIGERPASRDASNPKRPPYCGGVARDDVEMRQRLITRGKLVPSPETIEKLRELQRQEVAFLKAIEDNAVLHKTVRLNRADMARKLNESRDPAAIEHAEPLVKSNAAEDEKKRRRTLLKAQRAIIRLEAVEVLRPWAEAIEGVARDGLATIEREEQQRCREWGVAWHPSPVCVAIGYQCFSPSALLTSGLGPKNLAARLGVTP